MGLFLNKKQKSVFINANDKYVMWEIDISNIAFNTALIIDSFCQGIYVVNGQLRGICPPGRWTINSKLEKRDKNVMKLIGVNVNKPFVVKIAIEGIPYRDWEMDIETTVGMQCDCTVRIQNPWSLYHGMGKSNVTQEEVGEFIRNKILGLLKTEFALVLQKYDYFNITTEQTHIETELVKKIKEKLDDVDCENVLLEISFSEEYLRARKKKRGEQEDWSDDECEKCTGIGGALDSMFFSE